MKAIRKALEKVLAKPNLALVAAGVAIGYATFTLAQTVSGAVVMPAIAAVFSTSVLELETDAITIFSAQIRYGALLSVLITFALVVVAAYFTLVACERRGTARTRPCPECTSSIPVAAKRCPRCTAVVQPEPA